MTQYTEQSLKTLYDHLILSDCVCMVFEKKDNIKLSNLKSYENKYLLHALEVFILNKKTDEICDLIREELGRRINKNV